MAAFNSAAVRFRVPPLDSEAPLIRLAVFMSSDAAPLISEIAPPNRPLGGGAETSVGMA